jgi:hypothetical protein
MYADEPAPAAGSGKVGQCVDRARVVPQLHAFHDPLSMFFH